MLISGRGRRCSISSELAELSSKCKEENQISELRKLVFNAVIWFIWRERNNIIFNKESTHKVKLFEHLKQVIQIRMSSSTKISSADADQGAILQNWSCTPNVKHIHLAHCSWKALDEEWIKVNTDGFLSNSEASYVAIVCDFKGEVTAMAHSTCVNEPIHLIEL